MTSHSPNSQLIKPHKWIVYRLHDGQIRAALLKTKSYREYFRRRSDILFSVLITAFNRSEAWHKGKDLVKE